MGGAKTPEDVPSHLSLNDGAKALAPSLNKVSATKKPFMPSLQLRILSLGLLQDGEVGVGVTEALARFQRELRISEGGRPRPKALQIEGPT
jgi:hypothetical protein